MLNGGAERTMRTSPRRRCSGRQLRCDLTSLMAPRSVALVGVSTRHNAAGTKVMRNLADIGFEGPVYLVNPHYDAIDGVPCYPRLADLPAVPDAVFVAIPASAGPPVVEEAARLGVSAAFVNASGYGDGEQDGVGRQAVLEAVAAEHGMAVCGPNNMGLVNVHDRVAMWTGKLPRAVPGKAAIIAQSGSVGMVIADGLRRVGLAYLVTTGNEAVVDVADYLEWVISDPRVEIVVLFVEVIRDAARFEAATLRAASRGIPVVAVKVGRTVSGAQAVSGHTGALAGDDRVYDAFFRRCGVVRANDLDELIELAAVFGASPKPPRSRHSLVITLSGGEAALAADLGGEAGLSMPGLGSRTAARLRKILPDSASQRNPLDAWGLGFDPAQFGAVLETVLDDEQFGLIVTAIDVPRRGGIDAESSIDVARLYREALRTTEKKLVILNNAASLGVYEPLLEETAGMPIPVLSGMRAGLSALARWAGYCGPVEPATLATDPKLRRLVRGLRDASPVEQFARLSRAGIPFAATLAAQTSAEAVAAAARLGFPVALKGVADELVHKSREGMVALDLRTKEDVHRAAERLLAALDARPGAALLVQKLVEPGLEVVFGARQDPDFGTVIVVGRGGTIVEALQAVTVRLGPVDEPAAAEMLLEALSDSGERDGLSADAWDVRSASRIIARLSQVAHLTRTDVRVVEVNPLIVHAEGAVAVDLVIE